MSKYTTELRYICEQQSGLSESTDDYTMIIETARPKIFSFDYPIFDETYRPILETKIIKHYYTREIGAETYGLWKMWLDARMNEIMPYYNKLYNSELIKFDPLRDTDYYKEGSNSFNRATNNTLDRNQKTDYEDNRDRQINTDTNETTANNLSELRTDNLNQLRTDNLNEKRTDNLNETTAHSGKDVTENQNEPKKETWDLYSDTPQGGIAGIQGVEDPPSLADNGYLTNARHVLEDGTGSTNDTTTTYGSVENTVNTGTQDRTNTGTQNTAQTGTQRTDNTGNVNVEGNAKTTDNIDTTGNNETKIDEIATGKQNDIGNFMQHIYGKFPGKSYSILLNEFRSTLLNIDMMIIEELGDLFMNIW